ncbi:MAG: hypothetical protein JNK72_14805 [Myxococcales bacterium]|nr:hypothetical protein [Myxococcales bacterium]
MGPGLINLELARRAVERLRETLGEGLIATDVWLVEDAVPIVGFNSQPVATALFHQITDSIQETLAASGFPALSRYYLLDLEGDKLVAVLPMKRYRAGMLVDKKKSPLGVVVSVALPRYLALLDEAVRAGA